MKTIKHVRDIQTPFVATIGNFDGFHTGHKNLIRQLVSHSIRYKAKTCVITFFPHPCEILRPDIKGFLINSYEEKKDLIEQMGIDYFLPLQFTRDFSTKNPEQFIKEYLEEKELKAIHLGYDFSFGENKQGDCELIKKYFSNKNIDVFIQEKFCLNNERVSSSQIRNLIKVGNFEAVTALLERNFFSSGVVLKGEGRGKKIGFPTANINLDEKRVYPGLGVYITKTTYNNVVYYSITNVGVNPTFGEMRKTSIETNIFDFDDDIYGERIRVEFLKKIRPEIAFSSVNELVSQISKDVCYTREYFGI